MVTAETPPMSFPGRWPGYGRMRLETGHKPLALGSDTNGPASLRVQALWLSPTRTIVGGGAWEEGCAPPLVVAPSCAIPTTSRE